MYERRREKTAARLRSETTVRTVRIVRGGEKNVRPLQAQINRPNRPNRPRGRSYRQVGGERRNEQRGRGDHDPSGSVPATAARRIVMSRLRAWLDSRSNSTTIPRARNPGA